METIDNVLECAKFGLIATGMQEPIFANDLTLKTSSIRREQYLCDFDHRPFLPNRDRDFKYLLTEEYRRGYACFKYAVSRVIQPESIIEIGVGAGTGALAMLHACPDAEYLGIDDNSKCAHDAWDFTGFVKEWMAKLNFKFNFMIQDSLTIMSLPSVSLFHVDGDHAYKNAFNDSLLAFNSGSKWILVDDSRDLTVVRGAFDALAESKRAYEWAYFDDTWTGNLLFCAK